MAVFSSFIYFYVMKTSNLYNLCINTLEKNFPIEIWQKKQRQKNALNPFRNRENSKNYVALWQERTTFREISARIKRSKAISYWTNFYKIVRNSSQREDEKIEKS